MTSIQRHRLRNCPCGQQRLPQGQQRSARHLPVQCSSGEAPQTDAHRYSSRPCGPSQHDHGGVGKRRRQPLQRPMVWQCRFSLQQKQRQRQARLKEAHWRWQWQWQWEARIAKEKLCFSRVLRASSIAVLLLSSVALLEPSVFTADASRSFKQRVQLGRISGESNPRLERVEFDPLLLDLEQARDDKVWEERFAEEHHRRVHVRQHRRHHDDGEDGSRPHDRGATMAEEIEEEVERAHSAAAAAAGAHNRNNGHAAAEVDGFYAAAPVSEDHLLDSDHFDIADRLRHLFPLIDIDPPDGAVSLGELVEWHLQLEKRASQHQSDREMDAADADGDGVVIVAEALAHMGNPHGANAADPYSDEHEEMLLERFQLADANNNLVLDRREFHDFVHPEVSHNPRLVRLMAREELRSRDHDGDEQLSFEEFFHGGLQEELSQRLTALSDSDTASASSGGASPATHGSGGLGSGNGDGRHHHDHHHHHHLRHLEDLTHDLRSQHSHRRSGHSKAGKEEEDSFERQEAAAVQTFHDVDKNLDGFICVDEFTPLMQLLWPGHDEFAKEHSQNIIRQVDADGDGRLTLEEMLQRPHALYHTVSDPEDGELLNGVHDEF